MEILDTLTVARGDAVGEIRLLRGDLTALTPDAACDVLVVSAFPGSYAPTRGTLIAALGARGVRVADLARAKEVDLRHTSSCWLSRPLGRPDLHVGRVLCFEPATTGQAAELVGDVFRSLFPFVTGEPWVRRVAMPLLASGSQRQPDDLMLRAMVDAATHWIAAGLTLDRLDIVLRADKDATAVDRLRAVFAAARPVAESLNESPAETPRGPRAASSGYDLFISYSHQDGEVIAALRDEIGRLAPDLRVFLDSSSLSGGASWQQRIYAALEASERVLCLYSPGYLSSKVCMEELHLAILLNRDREGILIPAYLRSAELPAYLRLIQYVDVREGDTAKITDLARRIVADIRSTPVGAAAPTPPPDAAAPRDAAGDEAPPRAAASDEAAKPFSQDLTALIDRLARGDLEVQIEATVRFRPAGAGRRGTER